MTQNRWQPLDGYRTLAAARRALPDLASDLRQTRQYGAAPVAVRVRARPVAEELPYLVEYRELSEAHQGWSNQATWHAALIVHNEYDIYTATHTPARLAVLRERPWSVARWVIELRASWLEASADLRRDTAKMPGPIDWLEIATSCADEIRE